MVSPHVQSPPCPPLPGFQLSLASGRHPHSEAGGEGKALAPLLTRVLGGFAVPASEAAGLRGSRTPGSLSYAVLSFLEGVCRLPLRMVVMASCCRYGLWVLRIPRWRP